MSIEDVDYLLENSDPNSISIFVDSKRRNMGSFATPSQYVVNFDQPIRNVYGIEILDATVPVTAYSIDVNSNAIPITWIFNHPSISVTDKSPDSFPTTLALLASCPEFDELFSALINSNLFVTRSYTQFVNMYAQTLPSHPSSVKSTHAVFFVTSVSVNLSGGTYSVIGKDGATYYFEDPNHALVDLSDPTGYINAQASLESSGSYFTIDRSQMMLNYYEYFYLYDDQAGPSYVLSADDRAYQLIGSSTSTWAFDFLISSSVIHIQPGNYGSQTLLSEMQTLLNTFSAFIGDPRMRWLVPNANLFTVYFQDMPMAGADTVTQTITWFANTTDYPFILDMNKCTCAFLLGFSEYAATNEKKPRVYLKSYYPSGYQTLTYGQNYKLFMSINDATLQNQLILSPGLINIESARFIVLRCEEIESHMLGSYANFSLSPGIGMFKLLSSNSLMSLRFDFVNVQKRPFHPIGKLSKLTLRFENQDGSLYDFRGIDHVLLFSIKYYAPKNVLRIPTSKLNPYYLPNILEYQLKEYEDRSLKKRVSNLSINKLIKEQQQYMD